MAQHIISYKRYEKNSELLKVGTLPKGAEAIKEAKKKKAGDADNKKLD